MDPLGPSSGMMKVIPTTNDSTNTKHLETTVSSNESK